MAPGVRTRMVGGVLVVALRLVGRVSKMFYPAPSLEEQVYDVMVAPPNTMRVINTGAVWRIADWDGTFLPGSWPSPQDAAAEARAVEIILRSVGI